MTKVLTYFGMSAMALTLVMSSCRSDHDPVADGGVRGGAVDDAKAFFESQAGSVRSDVEPGNTFWPGDFTPKWEQASTTVSDGVRYVSVPIAPHYYYVVQWNTDDGPVEVAAFQRLVVAKNLTTGARECYVATFVPRSSYSRWSANPATRFRFDNAGSYHGLLFTATLDGRPLNFMAYDRGRQLFDTSKDGNGVVAPMMRKAFGASTGLAVSYFWLVRTRADDECSVCNGSNNYCSLLECGHWTCDGCTPVNSVGATYNDMMGTPEMQQFREYVASETSGNEHATSYRYTSTGIEVYGYVSGTDLGVGASVYGDGSAHSHDYSSAPSVRDIYSTGYSAGKNANYSTTYVVNSNGSLYAIVVDDPVKAAQFSEACKNDIDSWGNFDPDSDIGRKFNSHTVGLSPYNTQSAAYVEAMGDFLSANNSGMSVVSLKTDDNGMFVSGSSYGHKCSLGGK